MPKTLQRLRRIHALEHATMHVLARRGVRGRLLGRSDWAGFTLYGDVDTGDVAVAAHEALARLKEGEPELAVHPNCGTNVAVGGLLALVAGYLAFSGQRHRRVRGSLAGALLMTSLVAAQPLGLLAQAHLTTRPDAGRLQIDGISYLGRANATRHRIRVREG